MSELRHWFFIRDGEKHGPVTEGELTVELAHLPTPADALVWRPELPDWIPAASVPAIANLLPPPLPACVLNPIPAGPQPVLIPRQVAPFVKRDAVTDTERIWRSKTDEQLLDASSSLAQYTQEGEGVIRAELRRRSFPERSPTERSRGTEHDDEGQLRNVGKIAGWLLLPAVALVLGLCKGLLDISAYYSTASSASNPEAATVLALSVVWVAVTLVVAGLFLRKHRWAPRLYIALIVANILLVSLDLINPVNDPTFGHPATRFMTGVFSGTIWIWYFLVSRRVKLTFVK
jgi:hypothetical protein